MDINALIAQMTGGGGGTPQPPQAGPDVDYRDMNQSQLAHLPPEVLQMLGLDPHNQIIPGMPPLPEEDAEQDGYWDAKNRGNGRGNSFQMSGGKQIAADPVGLPPEIAQLMEMIGPAAGSGAAAGSQMAQGMEPGAIDEGLMAIAAEVWADENGGQPKSPEQMAEVEEMASWIMEQTGGDPEAIQKLLSQR